MPNHNRHEVCGHLGHAPEIHINRETGRPYSKFTVATSNDYLKNGEWAKRPPSWHRVVVWGDLAEKVHLEFCKGDAIMARGKSHTREYQDKSGEKRWSTELEAVEIYRPIYVKRSNEPEPIDPESEPSGDLRDAQESMSLRGEEDFMALVESIGKETGDNAADFPFGNNARP